MSFKILLNGKTLRNLRVLNKLTKKEIRLNLYISPLSGLKNYLVLVDIFFVYM